MRADVLATRPVPAGHDPEIDVIARRIEPEHIAGAVVVEIAGRERRPAGRMRSGVGGRRPARRPYRHVRGGNHLVGEGQELDVAQRVVLAAVERPHQDLSARRNPRVVRGRPVEYGDVAAGAAVEPVEAGTAVKDVVACAAGERVTAGVAK